MIKIAQSVYYFVKIEGDHYLFVIIDDFHCAGPS